MKRQGKCKICGKTFYYYPKCRPGNYCSRHCLAEAKKKQSLSINHKKKISNSLKEFIKNNGPVSKGYPPWNKGLTKTKDKRILDYSKKISKTRKRLFKENKLVSPMKGKKHKLETKLKMRRMRLKQILPVKDTKIEKLIQNKLKELKYDFEIHYSYPKARTQIDIAFPKLKVAIYCDGDYWHNLPSYKKRDKKQNEILNKNGWIVLRFWEHEILNSLSSCLSIIKAEVTRYG